MKFSSYETPVAYSMIWSSRQQPDLADVPIYAFSCYWMAFNNIYVTVAERKGQLPKLQPDANGKVKRKLRGHVQIPVVKPIAERDQIALAVDEFSDDLKHALIMCPTVTYFVERTPYWRGMPIEKDTAGQRLNGVLNVGQTVNAEYPVWSPIDPSVWKQYVSGHTDHANGHALATQIVDMLYTVRNNTFHGGKRADDAQDRSVVENALPLLRMIVESFLE